MDLALVDMLRRFLELQIEAHASHLMTSDIHFAFLFSTFATHLLCPICAAANDTGWPTVGKTSATLKPPERRDSGSDIQGKSPPSGSPIAPSAEKVCRHSSDLISTVYQVLMI